MAAPESTAPFKRAPSLLGSVMHALGVGRCGSGSSVPASGRSEPEGSVLSLKRSNAWNKAELEKRSSEAEQLRVIFAAAERSRAPLECQLHEQAESLSCRLQAAQSIYITEIQAPRLHSLQACSELQALRSQHASRLCSGNATC